MASRANPEIDRRFMGMAIALGTLALGTATPNPAVGCVLVKGGKIIGFGRTASGGRPHAETEAIKHAGARARGATAYVSLEPCAHFGQTPPCAEAMVRAGIKRAVIGRVDPFPQVRGRGIAILKRAGIEVTTGVCEEEATRANEGFFTRVEKGRPMLVLKLAITLDGRIATASGDSRWISSEESRAMVHEWRRESDAVMVGAGTVVADNPRLTCRIEGGRDPVRVIIDGSLSTAPGARVYRQRSTAGAIIVTAAGNADAARRRYGSARVEVIAAKSRGGEIDLAGVMRRFGERGWNRVLLEGGAHLAASTLKAGIVDRVALFIAPRILGGGLPAIEGLKFARVKDSIRLDDLAVRRIGTDLLVEGKPSAG